MNDPKISVQALAKTYGFGARKMEAVRGIDFEVIEVKSSESSAPMAQARPRRCRCCAAS
jgi:hypothetical protein